MMGLVLNLGPKIGQKLSKSVTQMLHHSYDIEYIGNIPQVQALFNELPYILRNVQRMNSSTDNDILGGASKIDEFGNLFFVNGVLEFLDNNSLNYYLDDDSMKKYRRIANRITNLYAFNETWNKNPLKFGNIVIAKKNIRSVTDYANLTASIWQEIKGRVNSDKYKESYYANLLQNYIYYSYSIELIQLFNLVNDLPADIFDQIISPNTIIEGNTKWSDLKNLFLIADNDILDGLENTDFLTQVLGERSNWTVVESIFFAKNILENDLVQILKTGLDVFDL